MNYELAHNELKLDEKRQKLIKELELKQFMSSKRFTFGPHHNTVVMTDEMFTMIIEALENESK